MRKIETQRREDAEIFLKKNIKTLILPIKLKRIYEIF